MPAISIRCTGCGARLKAPEGKAKVRCPSCGTVLRVPPRGDAPEADPAPGEEALDRLEEVEEGPAPIRHQRNEDGDRPRRFRRLRPGPAWADYIWLGAIGLAVFTFFISFGVTLLAFGIQGLPENDQGGGVLFKIAVLLFGVLGGLALAAGGVYCAKTQTIYDRWGQAMKGPFAAILATVVALTGSMLGGFTLYGLLLALIRGR